MSTSRERAVATFDTEQFTILDRTLTKILSPLTDQLTRSIIERLFFDAVCAAFTAGRFSGVTTARDTIIKIISEHERSEVCNADDEPTH